MEAEICPYCKAKMMKHKHSLNANFVRILYKFWEANPPANPKNIGYTFNERANFQKLRYWDLITKHKVDGERIDGLWDITNKGKWFLTCKLQLYKTVVTYRNERVGYEGNLITASKLWDQIMYKKRPEYIDTWEPFLFDEESWSEYEKE